jgi:selenocysteine lyase/cysteine desulfurase
VSFTLEGRNAQDVARALGQKGLFVWDGDFYAMRLVELLGLGDRGGLVRVGLAPYNTADEVERVIAAVAELA